MLKCNIQPDRITLSGVLSACSFEGLVNEGIKMVSLFEDKYHIVPGVEHYTCVVDMLSRAGMLGEAVDFVESKLQKCIVAALSNVLEASLIKRDFRMAELIAEKMTKLKPRSSLPYVVLAQSYGADVSGKAWPGCGGQWKIRGQRKFRNVVGSVPRIESMCLLLNKYCIMVKRLHMQC
ncbi:hypothetical protein OsJ_11386 [Oryza sativa Japonica Group]|uniref:Pentatricopeptide repeat-containing protein n=1 Tax=Oryza sativa subsp. japonica TaxID=39947 RepID=B9F975_ORYSJ|nr:hypothetical protein OsJ_11386 [Oryza sativa Japonica Group]